MVVVVAVLVFLLVVTLWGLNAAWRREAELRDRLHRHEITLRLSYLTAHLPTMDERAYREWTGV